MKSNKKPIVCLIALAIAGLVITSTAASISYVEQSNISETKETVGVPTKLVSMDAALSVVKRQEAVAISPMEKMLSLGADFLCIQDVDDMQDCQNAGLVTTASKSNILVFTEIYEDIGHNHIYGRFSSDGGVNWDDMIYGWAEIPEGDPDDVSKPRLDYMEDDWAYGAVTAGNDYDATTYYFELPSIIDPDYAPNGYGWVVSSVDWTQVADFSDFDSADIGSFPYDAAVSPNPEFFGIIFGTGDRPSGANEEDDTMWFQYSVEDNYVVIWSFYNMEHDVEKMSGDIDISLGQPYLVMEYEMEEDPSDTGSVYYKSPPLRPDSYPDDNWVQDGDFSGFYFSEFYNPDIVAADGSVYLVGDDASGDIICLYSSDAGDNFEASYVSDDAGAEAFPQIAISGDTLVCSYIRDGNLYVKTSDDGGVNWENEQKINDPDGTVVEQYGCAGIDGPYGSWTDDRESPPLEIYFDTTVSLGNPPGIPTITGRKKGNAGKSYAYTFNAADPDGDDVRYIIEWDDGKSDTTGYNPEGTDVTVSHTWDNDGDYTITAYAQDVNGLTGGTKEYTVQMPRTRAVNSLFLWFIQQFPVLRYILTL
jgi:hypothetical protein